MSGYGGLAWGGGEWGGESLASVPPLLLERALAVRENVVRVTFNRAVVYTRLETAHDASVPSRFAFASVSSDARAVLPVLVEEVSGDELSLDVSVDRHLSGYPALYRASATGVVDELGVPVSGPGADFLGVVAERPALSRDQAVGARDVLIPQLARDLRGVAPDSILGALAVDASGDLATGSPLAGYRTRVVRRIATATGAFAHLVGYGAGLAGLVKKPALASAREALAAFVEEQVRLEPETVSCVATLSVSPDGLAVLKVRCLAVFGSVDVETPLAA